VKKNETLEEEEEDDNSDEGGWDQALELYFERKNGGGGGGGGVDATNEVNSSLNQTPSGLWKKIYNEVKKNGAIGESMDDLLEQMVLSSSSGINYTLTRGEVNSLYLYSCFSINMKCPSVVRINISLSIIM
jgi:hypothetical protein